MIDYIRSLIKPKYEPFNRVEILKDNLISNYKYLKSIQPDSMIWPVLKSNAYGHGLREVCQILKKTDCEMVCVDSYPEAQVVYKYFDGKVLVIGEMPAGAYKYCDFNRTEFVVYNIETIKALGSLNKEVKVHLFVNTGMNREGAERQEVVGLLNAIKEFENIEVVGVCSHLASADEESRLNKVQEENFWKFVGLVKSGGHDPKWLHLGNSAGVFVLNGKYTAFRAGISFYGYTTFGNPSIAYDRGLKLKPALRVVSRVVSARRAIMGQKVSYNETFIVEKDTNLAVIPFGYTEGLDRRLSNRLEVLVQSKSGNEFRAKIVGRVCMNLSVIDCGDNEVKVGDRVIVISENRDEHNSVDNVAALMETISYEVLVKINSNIRRVIK